MRTKLLRMIQAALQQKETRRWMASHGMRKRAAGQGGGVPQSTESAKVPGELSEVEATLGQLLSVFEVRDKDRNGEGVDLNSAELEGLMRSLGVVCTADEVEAFFKQMQQIAGNVSGKDVAAMMIAQLQKIATLKHHKKENQDSELSSGPAGSVSLAMLALAVRRHHLLSHIMDGTEKGPEKRTRMVLSAPHGPPVPSPRATKASQQLAEVTAEVTRRSAAKRSSSSTRQETKLFSVPSTAAPSRATSAVGRAR